MSTTDTAINAGTQIITSLLGHSSGGSNLTTACPYQDTPEKVQAIITRLSQSELSKLYSLFAATKPSWLPTTPSGLLNPALFVTIAFALAGGSDCKVSSNEGKALVAFWGEMTTKYYGMLGVTSTDPAPGPYIPAPTPDQSNWDKLKDAVAQYVGSVEQYVTSTAQAGVQAANNTANAGATAARQNATATSVFGSLGIGTMVIIGVAVIALVFAFGRK